ncbi:hypothetical protein [Metabacillus malikii]|uniref:DUF4878 domain-containing protein n=1 Tax=Metabacillus malikii TaxID=1504265 RepID=A0ABT9ZDL3_9BACI|nr:hypothetical protein [Metabacillus malikii]MDQ0230349.1 hypothetical protein [Metabacillus malikii]
MVNKKTILTFLLLLLFLPFQVQAEGKDPVTIGTRNNALTAAVSYLGAMKECDEKAMDKYSVSITEQDRQKQGENCKKLLLEHAEVTDYIIVSNDLALVSTKLDYANKVVVQTSPIVKIEGKWKIVVGIEQQHPFTSVKETNPNIIEAINTYLESIKSANQKGIDTYGKQLSKDNQQTEGLLEGSESNSFQYQVDGVKMVANSVAIASIKTKVNEQIKEQKYVVYLEDSTWKVISDRYLVTASIPKSANPVKVE